MKLSIASVALLQCMSLSHSFVHPLNQVHAANIGNNQPHNNNRIVSTRLFSSNEPKSTLNNFSEADQNRVYIEGLLQNLQAKLDRWIVTGSNGIKDQAFNIMTQIKRESMDEELFKQALRMAERASLPVQEYKTKMNISSGENNATKRKSEAEERKEWGKQRNGKSGEKASKFPGNVVGSKPGGRSALSNRVAANGKPDLFMPDVGRNRNPDDIENFAQSKKGLEDALAENIGGKGSTSSDTEAQEPVIDKDTMTLAEEKSSEIVAKAGAGSAFEGGSLGIGGLDDVLAQIKRRIWVPLAAPPSLLKELGINPVRGLLLYGLPGCGKTLLARSLGKILSPARPITVVSGPEIMDKFVGSSEANLRAIFDNPPEIYDSFRIGTKDNGKALEKVALHVIVLDEFDAMARTRGGGSGGSSSQGDAGQARDSVVNQLLAKMDGVDPLVVPTLVIGMTNRRTLIEPALLRPGRFEVQIEVPKPKTVAQRVSILNVHMKSMFEAGRLFVKDAPLDTAARRRIDQKSDINDIPDYDELLDSLAVKCDSFSGAMLAGVARAAASRALERAVCDFAGHFDQKNDTVEEGYSIADCLVTKEDFEHAIEDVLESSKEGDGGEEDKDAEEITDSSDDEDESDTEIDDKDS